jgi:hypothetical protein
MVEIGGRSAAGRWGCVVGAVLALTACGQGADVNPGGSGQDGSAGGTSGEDGVLPFVDRPAVVPEVMPQEEIAGPEVPECSAEMVEFRLVTAEEVLGSPDASVAPEVRNVAVMAKGDERCGVGSWPVLRLVDADGSPADGLVGEGAPAPDRRLLLEGRQRLVGFLRWHSWCSAPAGARVEAQLPGGGEASAALGDPPACDPTKSNVGGPWMTFPELPPEGPFAIELVDAPRTAPAGGTLRFTLVVRNPGTVPINLDPCPVMDVRYGESGTLVALANELNCDAAPAALGPGDSLLQAVEMDLPLEEIRPGFVGSFSVSLYTDADHQSAHTDPLELTAE